MYRLIVCEKPSVAQSIAAALGAKQHREGYLEGKDDRPLLGKDRQGKHRLQGGH